MSYFRLGRLPDTLERLAQAGWRDFYEGEIAASIVADVKQMGGVLSAEDLRNCKARVLAGDRGRRGAAARLQLAGPLTAAPTAADVLRQMADVRFGAAPDAAWYVALARALKAAYAQRLTSLGDAEPQAAESCTTHITVVRCRRHHGGDDHDAALLDGQPRGAAGDRHPDEQRRDVVRSAPGPAELDRAGQAAAHQHVPGHPARRRAALDRGRRVRRPPHHGGGAAAACRSWRISA